MKIWGIKITNVKVTKHRVGENSTFNSTISKQFWFIATFKFNTGSIVELSLVEPREEYADMPTMKITYSDELRAKEQAFKEYQVVHEMISRPEFLYARH